MHRLTSKSLFSSGKLGPVRVPLARAARGTLAAESELAEREKDLAYERSALALLEADSRAVRHDILEFLARVLAY